MTTPIIDAELENKAKEYAEKNGWPTKQEWLVSYRDGLMAYEIRYEVEEAFEDGARYQAEKISKTHVPLGDVQILLDCLNKIATEDFRGNRLQASVDAYKCLEAFDIRTHKRDPK